MKRLIVVSLLAMIIVGCTPEEEEGGMSQPELAQAVAELDMEITNLTNQVNELTNEFNAMRETTAEVDGESQATSFVIQLPKNHNVTVFKENEGYYYFVPEQIPWGVYKSDCPMTVKLAAGVWGDGGFGNMAFLDKYEEIDLSSVQGQLEFSFPDVNVGNSTMDCTLSLVDGGD